MKNRSRVPSAECRVPSAECRVPSAEWRWSSVACSLIALATLSASGQVVGPLDMSHSWSVKGQSSSEADVATGVAVDQRGATFAGGTYALNATTFQGFARMYTPGSASAGRLFVNYTGGGVGQAFVNGVCTSRYSGLADATGFYAGSFRNDINFNSGGTPPQVLTTDGSDDAFVVKLSSPDIDTATPTIAFKSVTRIGGAGVQEALAVSASHGEGIPGGRYAVVGRFTNQLAVGVEPVELAKGAEDGFIVLFEGENDPPPSDPTQGHLVQALLTIGDANLAGQAMVKTRGVEIDPQGSGLIIVTGEFKGSVDFAPGPCNGGFVLDSTGTGTDIFVAGYRYIDCVAGPKELTLQWIYTTSSVGAAGNDSGTDVASDINGHVYATGWKAGTSSRDIWIAKLRPDGGGPLNVTEIWAHTIGGTGDDVGWGIDVDGLDRIMVTGQFAGTLDFQPGTGTSNLVSAGGLDAFIVRYRDHLITVPGPVTFDGGYRVGGTGADVGRAVGVDPLKSTRHAWAGSFSGSNIDFNPGSGTNNLSSTGSTDPFISTILPTIPSDVKSQVVVTVDTSGSTTPEEYDTLMGIYASILPDPTIIPQDKKLAMAFSHTAESDPAVEDQIVPWTVISATNAAQFAARVAANPQSGGSDGTTIDQSIQSMQDMQHGDRISACWRQLFVVSDGENRGFNSFPSGSVPVPDLVMQVARDDVLGTYDDPNDVNVTHINAFAALGDDNAYWNGNIGIPPPPIFGRGYMKLNVTGSDMDQEPFWGNMGLAMESATVPLPGPPENQYLEPSVQPRLSLMLKRMTRCPGDFDRDGDVDSDDLNHPSTGFMAAYNASQIAADWDLDGDVDNDDLAHFLYAHDKGCCP
jgi:Protein of unknown function (DUF1194)